MKNKSVTRTAVFSPDSPLHDKRLMLRTMFADLRAAWNPACAIVSSNLLTKYRQSLLGILWLVLPPLILTISALLARRANVMTELPTEIPYALYVLVSTIIWQTFCEAAIGPLQLTAKLRPTLSKISFPREALIIASLLETFLAFLPKVLFICLLLLWFGFPVTISVLLGVLAVFPLILLGTAVGIMVTPFSLIYEDLGRLLSLVLGAWLFFTPVLYPLPPGGALRTIVNINPVTPLLITVREVFTSSSLTSLNGYSFVFVLTVFVLSLSWVTLRIAIPFAVERLSW